MIVGTPHETTRIIANMPPRNAAMTENGIRVLKKKGTHLVTIPLIPRVNTSDHVVEVPIRLAAVVKRRKESIEQFFGTIGEIEGIGSPDDHFGVECSATLPIWPVSPLYILLEQ